VHRDAIPVLAALSLIAVAIHGAVEHLLEWARRLFAQLETTPIVPARARPRFRVVAARPLSLPHLSNGPRGPPVGLGSVVL
jgi:uncharacterized protein (DUF3084 family)